jgi:hypothetical protein
VRDRRGVRLAAPPTLTKIASRLVRRPVRIHTCLAWTALKPRSKFEENLAHLWGACASIRSLSTHQAGHMSKFTVIEGGGKGPPDRRSGAARYHLQQAIIEILRSLVRGYDAQQRVTAHLTEFIQQLANTDAPLEVIVNDAIAELHKELDHKGELHISEQERETIVLRALQVAAEAMATDPGAKGRLSARESKLHSAIDHQFLRREQRAKERQLRTSKTPKGSIAASDRAPRPRRNPPRPRSPGSDDDIIV